MYTFDLKWFLLVLLLAMGGLVLATIGALRWWRRRRQSLAALTTLQTVLVNAPVAVVALDQHSRIHYVNPAAQRLLALTPTQQTLPKTAWADELQRDWQLLQEPRAEAGRYRTLQLHSQTEQPLTVRWWLTRWHELTLLFVTDITTQQRSEQAAQVLLSDLAHELRTPLATLLTHLEVLRLPAVADATRSQSLDFMKTEVQRLVRLSNNLVELGRLQASGLLAPQAVDLPALVESLLLQVRPSAAERQMQVSLTVQGRPAPVLGDPDRLRQLFLNLIENAIKYGAPGNQITIALVAEAQGMVCAVADTGPGIPADQIPHLTRRFYRAAPAGVSGSGLGLALVVEILRQHQSRLIIESQTEGAARGTWMRFTLPLAQAVTPPTKNEAAVSV